MYDEEDLQEESVQLANGVLNLIDCNRDLIHLITRLINKYGDNDSETRAELQIAYNKYKKAKQGLEAIGFFEQIQ